MNMPACPRCRTSKEVGHQGEGNLYVCHRCKGLFDNDPNEGGDHSDFNPAIRLEREDRRREHQRQRRGYR